MLRVLFSTNPAIFRVSKTGFDAGTGSVDDMLIDSTNTLTKVIMSGRIHLVGTVVVPFGITLPSIPAVDLQTADSADASLIPFRKYGYAQAQVTCTPSATGLTFGNTGGAVWMNYVCVAVTLPV
jgi:hypothetical protein